MKSLPNNHI